MADADAMKLLSVKVVKFDYKEEFGGIKNQYGCIAEDVQQCLPFVVTIADKYDENKPISTTNPAPSIDYSKFVPYLIKMVQIQQDEINELKARIDAIEN